MTYFEESFFNELEKIGGYRLWKPSLKRFFLKTIFGSSEPKKIEQTVGKIIIPKITKNVDNFVESAIKQIKPEVTKSLKKSILPIIGVSAASGTAAGAGFYGMKKLLNPKKNEQDFLTKLY